MTDFVDFEHTTSNLTDENNPFSKRVVAEVIDSNAGIYSTSLKFNCASLYNTSSFNDFRNTILDIPLIAVVSQAVDGATAAHKMADNPLTFAMKNGYYNLIDSVKVVYDNVTIQEHVERSTFYTSFKMHSQMTVNDEEAIGSTIGYAKDTATSWSYNKGGYSTDGDKTEKWNNPDGNGMCNNVPRVDNIYNEDRVNKGMRKRQSYVTDPNKSIDLISPQNGFITNSTTYSKMVPGTSSKYSYQVYYFNALIRLADVSDVMSKFPIIKGGLLQLEFNLNIGSLFGEALALPTGPGVYPAATFDNATLKKVSVQQQNTNFGSTNVCPFMIAASNSNCFAPGDAQTHFTAGIYIGKVTSSIGNATTTNHSALGVEPHTRQYCRLLIPQYEMQASIAGDYLDNFKLKSIDYETIQYTRVESKASSSTNIAISESCVNPVGLLVIPMLNQSSNDGLDVISSPFTTEPATSSPVCLTSFNVDLNGTPVYGNGNINYGYEHYLSEINGIMSSSGNRGVGFGSGISLNEFNNNYKYYYVNLERRVVDDIQSKSIKLRCANNSLVDLSLHTFLVLKKNVTIDIQTGKLLTVTNTAI